MDKLFQILPEDVVRHVMTYSTNPICNDDYFTYQKLIKIHESLWNVNRFYLNPTQMLDLYSSQWNQMFIYECRDMDVETGLTRRLDNKTGEWKNSFRGMNIVEEYTRKIFNHPELSDYFKEMGYSQGKVALDIEIANSYVFKWLIKLNKLEHYVNKKNKAFSGSWETLLAEPYMPDINMKKPAIQQLLTNNGITWRKTWNRKKLLNAWYKAGSI